MFGTVFAWLEIFLVGVLTLLVFRLLFRQRIPQGLHLPPGPSRKPVVGNILQMPIQQEWVTLARWAKEYGNLVYLSGLGQSILIINSKDIVYELFERRSSIYSDRGEFPMVNGLMGWDWIVSLMRYSDLWRRHRKVIHQKFHPAAVTEYMPVQLKHARILLQRLYESPDLFVEHLRHNSGAIIMEIVYGIKVLPNEDPYITTAEKAMTGLSEAGNPGAFLVDVLPLSLRKTLVSSKSIVQIHLYPFNSRISPDFSVKYVPEWFPGAGFQKKARIWRKFAVEMNTAPFQAVKQALNSGVARPSFTSSLLEEISVKGNAYPGQEEVIRGAGSTLYAGGSDTTVNALHIFFLAMVLFPEAQRKAQEELNKVVGINRLPEYEDRENLPYINALCKEVLRWHPVTPLGVPHRVTQDDVFDGYLIPAGTIVVGNTWTLLRDEGAYGADTDKFQPERFLSSGIKDPNPAFGYGRRICPGRYFVSNSLYIAVASILSVFDIMTSRDISGKVIPVKEAFESGLLSHPASFQCTISPRSDIAKRLILQEISEPTKMGR